MKAGLFVMNASSFVLGYIISTLVLWLSKSVITFPDPFSCLLLLVAMPFFILMGYRMNQP